MCVSAVQPLVLLDTRVLWRCPVCHHWPVSLGWEIYIYNNTHTHTLDVIFHHIESAKSCIIALIQNTTHVNETGNWSTQVYLCGIVDAVWRKAR